MTLYGIDVSAYQGRPSWSDIYAAGIRFSFSKVTQGTTYVASTWAFDESESLALADEKDFLPGAYHFLSATEDPIYQARFFVSKLKSPEKMAIALDVERYVDSAGHTQKPTAGQARAFVEEFRSLLPGHPILGYVPRWYWNELGQPDLSFFSALWQSAYVSGSGAPTALFSHVSGAAWAGFGGSHVAVLQFSATGRVSGVDGSVDVNAFQGTLAELRALTLPTAAPVPVPGPEPKPGTVPIPAPPLRPDGELGPVTIEALQAVLAFRTHRAVVIDGRRTAQFIKALQLFLGVTADGDWGRRTTMALQRRVGTTPDGNLGPITIRALQRAINAGKF